MNTPAGRGSGYAADALLLLSFLISGVSALIYQVGWQRALFAYIGVDIDSMTIIVSVFMIGIGLGATMGGWLADRFPRRRLGTYALVELTIGLYGAISLYALPVLVNAFPASAGGSALACFIFLLLPTTLMGITLPILTMAFNERRGNVGVSVGTLYFTNTMGAAAGAALVPLVLLPVWTLPDVIGIAAAGNMIAMVCALIAAFAANRRQAAPE